MTTQLFLILFLLCPLVMGEETGFVGSIDPKSLGLDKKQNVSHFRFYWHDILSGNNATAVPIIPSVPKYNTTTSFGLVTIMDNPLTLGPELTSKLVGRAEGFYAFTSQSQMNMLFAMNFALSEGNYNGSTITILGRYVTSGGAVRDLPVIGGSGIFRFATGYAEARTHFFDPNTGDATTEYNVYVLHYA